MGLLLVAAAVEASACANAGAPAQGQSERGYAVDLGTRDAAFDRNGWRTDFGRHDAPLDSIPPGRPGARRDRPIDRPRAVAQRPAERYLSSGDPVVAVAVGRLARAYPVRTLVWHEVVNDRLGGRPIAVTYSPSCNSTSVFDRRVARRELTFETRGNLRHSNPVLWTARRSRDGSSSRATPSLARSPATTSRRCPPGP